MEEKHLGKYVFDKRPSEGKKFQSFSRKHTESVRQKGDIAGKLQCSPGVKVGRMEHKRLVSPDLEEFGLQLRAEHVL